MEKLMQSNDRILKNLDNGFCSKAIKAVRNTTSITDAIKLLNKQGLKSKYGMPVYRWMVIDACKIHGLDYREIQRGNRLQIVINNYIRKLKFQSAFNEILNIIKEKKDSGLSYRQIATELNKEGIPTKYGSVWIPSYIKNVENSLEFNSRIESSLMRSIEILEKMKSDYVGITDYDQLAALLNNDGYNKVNSVFLKNLLRLK
jgi:predicted DNA-binding transcriptional regulator